MGASQRLRRLTPYLLLAPGILWLLVFYVYPSIQMLISSFWSGSLETGYTVRQALRLIAAAVAGKSSGGPGSPVFRSLDDSAKRITATATSDGNRTAVTHSA